MRSEKLGARRVRWGATALSMVLTSAGVPAAEVAHYSLEVAGWGPLQVQVRLPEDAADGPVQVAGVDAEGTVRVLWEDAEPGHRGKVPLREVRQLRQAHLKAPAGAILARICPVKDSKEEAAIHPAHAWLTQAEPAREKLCRWEQVQPIEYWAKVLQKPIEYWAKVLQKPIRSVTKLKGHWMEIRTAPWGGGAHR